MFSKVIVFHCHQVYRLEEDKVLLENSFQNFYWLERNLFHSEVVQVLNDFLK